MMENVWKMKKACIMETAEGYVEKAQVILQTARIYIDASGKVPGSRSAVGLYCKFKRCAV